MWRTALVDGAALPPPDGFDAVAHVTRSLASVPWKWEVEVLLDLPVDEAARRIPATLAELVDDPDGTLLRMRVDSLDWMATVLAGLGCGFTIRRPDELRASVRALATQLAAQRGLAADGVDRLAELAAARRRGEREHDERPPAHPADADVVGQHPPERRLRHPLERHPAGVQPLRRAPARPVRRRDQLGVDPVRAGSRSTRSRAGPCPARRRSSA